LPSRLLSALLDSAASIATRGIGWRTAKTCEKIDQ
jgi:hypothetical protein